jgi:hypothetical protein
LEPVQKLLNCGVLVVNRDHAGSLGWVLSTSMRSLLWNHRARVSDEQEHFDPLEYREEHAKRSRRERVEQSFRGYPFIPVPARYTSSRLFVNLS